MRKLVMGLVGATALMGASAANATLVITTPTSVSVQGPSVVNTIDITFGITDSDDTSPFVETVSWMNDVGGLYNFRLFTTTDVADSSSDVDFTDAFVTGTGIVNPIYLTWDPSNTDLTEVLSLAGVELGAGTYTLTVDGTRGPDGVFAGHVDFSPVPEPATWALMLLGFGAVGWQLRRRRTSQVLAQAV